MVVVRMWGVVLGEMTWTLGEVEGGSTIVTGGEEQFNAVCSAVRSVC